MSDNETVILDFEKTIVDIEEKIQHLKMIAKDEDLDITKEIKRLEKHLQIHMANVYKNLSPWQKAQIARHPNRPHCLDYINALITDFTLLCGDRCFGDDPALVGGIGKFVGACRAHRQRRKQQHAGEQKDTDGAFRGAAPLPK